MEVSVLNMSGKETGKKVVLNDAIFAITPNEHAVYLDVKQFMANKRQGTAKAKQRSENAKSPVRVGGGTIFGPVPRDYSFKLNKKVKLLARKSAFSIKASNNQILVLDTIHFDAPKTKEMVAVLKNLKIDGKKVLFVLPQNDTNVLKSANNIQRTNVITVSELNTYTIMNSNAIVLLEEAVAPIEQLFKV